MKLRRKFCDLHRHLDGSLRAETVNELARQRGLEVPPDLRFRPGIGLEEALSKFAFMLSLLQEPKEVKRVAYEMCEDASTEGLDYLEIRFAPILHTGASNEAIVDAALEGLDEARNEGGPEAGLILCGLYGEDPAVLEGYVELAKSRPGVVGIDLAGGPAPTHRWRMEDYAKAFQRAESLGIGRTVHAGEGRPPQEIKVAIEVLRAQRIGHGTTLLSDMSVTDLVLERGVTIEACITSNVHVGAIANRRVHPLAKWLQLGIRAVICADNTLLSNTTAEHEVAYAHTIPGMTPELIEKSLSYGYESRFVRFPNLDDLPEPSACSDDSFIMSKDECLQIVQRKPGLVLQSLRELEEISLETLAQATGIHPEYLAKVEASETRPSQEELEAIAAYFDADTKGLLETFKYGS